MMQGIKSGASYDATCEEEEEEEGRGVLARNVTSESTSGSAICHWIRTGELARMFFFFWQNVF